MIESTELKKKLKTLAWLSSSVALRMLSFTIDTTSKNEDMLKWSYNFLTLASGMMFGVGCYQIGKGLFFKRETNEEEVTGLSDKTEENEKNCEIKI
jgi:hypothetical protein